MFNKLLKGRNLFVLFLLISGLAFIVFMIKPTELPETESHNITQIYFADNISPAHQKVIEQFNEKYRGDIEVIAVDLPFKKFSTNERKQLLTRTLRSKNSRIDVFSVDLIWVPRFAKWAEPLASYFSEEELNTVLKYALESCYYDDQLVSLPLYIDIGLLYYRRDLLRYLPDSEDIEKKLKHSITWRELIELAGRLSFLQKPIYIFPADNYEGLVCSFLETLAGQGTALFVGETIKLDTPEARKGLQLLVDLVNKYQITPPIVTEFREVDAYPYALKNDAFFFRGWPGNLRNREFMQKYGPKIANIEVGALPHFSGYDPAAVFGGWNLMVSKYSSKKSEAIKFLKFATNIEMQKIIFEEMGYLPVNKNIYEDAVFLKRYPELSQYRSYLDTGVHRPPLSNYTKISDILSYYINLAIREEISVTDALQNATERINSGKVLIF